MSILFRAVGLKAYKMLAVFLKICPPPCSKKSVTSLDKEMQESFDNLEAGLSHLTSEF